MATAKKKSADQPTFEDALSELETITASLENGDLTLDEALSVFEDGVKLMRTCDEHLRGAKGKLAELVKGENGEIVKQILGDDLESFINAEC